MSSAVFRKHAAALLSGVALFAAQAPARAESYPTRPVRIVVPFAPGGATDIVTRVLAQRLTETWGQTVVVDNRAGAGGNIGAELVVKSNPNGHTLLMAAGSIVTANSHIYKTMPFDADKDLVAVTNVASGPQVLAVANSVPAKSVWELVALAKTNPGSITYGSAGIASQTHLAAERFLDAAHIDAVHVPYKGEGPALTDLVAGQIQMITANLPAAIGFASSGKIRALAVTSRERAAQLPNVPAVAETLPGFENLGWFGLLAPAGTPKAVIEKLHNDAVHALQNGDLRRRFDDLGMRPVGNTPSAFAKAIRDESARWARIARDRKLVVE